MQDGGVATEVNSVSSTAPSSNGPCFPLEVGIVFDNYASETGFQVVEGNYTSGDDIANVVWRSEPFPESNGNTADTFHNCFPAGVYAFIFTDEGGDGICW